MTREAQELITALHLNDKADNERLAMARSLALKHLQSGAPIPKGIMSILTEESSPK